MKKILVPTDFSETAKNAANYAIELAKLIKAEVILLHVFDVPVSVSDISIVMSSPQEMKNLNVHEMKKHESELKAKHDGSIIISGITKMGLIFDEVNHFVHQQKIDLIVMGINGAGRVSEVVIGSNTTRVVKNINCSTIIVPEKAKFKQLKNIAFACDYNHVEGSKAVDKLIEFVKLVDAQLIVINIGKHAEKQTYSNNLAMGLLEYIFENTNKSLEIPAAIDYSIHERKDDDVVQGINRFVDKHNADLLVMIPRKHSFISSLFHESNTKKMAFHSHIPVLTFHDE